jgi:formylglycine-generating enzyme required for sulfatase activity
MKPHVPRFVAEVAVIVVALTASADANAPAGRYTTASGTVYDTKTKLTWQQEVPSGTYSWADARTYCAGLNLNGTGWRLPTCKELQTIVDDSQANPSIDTTAFPSTPASWFWSSSPLAGSSSAAWGVDFYFGDTGEFDVSNIFNVRCVR